MISARSSGPSGADLGPDVVPAPSVKQVGRPRDSSRDVVIVEETLAVLAEVGYERLTIDAVAARAGAARATVYRRWPTKAELVLDAVRRLSAGDVDPGDLPDTGRLRDDLVAIVLSQSDEELQYRMKIVAGVASLALTGDPRLAQTATTASLGSWNPSARGAAAARGGPRRVPEDLG